MDMLMFLDGWQSSVVSRMYLEKMSAADLASFLFTVIAMELARHESTLCTICWTWDERR
jgi:hypothetical protein